MRTIRWWSTRAGIGWDILIQMELLTPLNQYIRDHVVTRQDVIRLGIDLCKALELCQKYNIIHRDVKPENIFISETGDFKLGDFGIARTVEKTTSGLSKKGTYTYMAPEVYKGEAYGTTVDIYSLGIVLYRLLQREPDAVSAGGPGAHHPRGPGERSAEAILRGAAAAAPGGQREAGGDCVKGLRLRSQGAVFQPPADAPGAGGHSLQPGGAALHLSGGGSGAPGFGPLCEDRGGARPVPAWEATRREAAGGRGGTWGRWRVEGPRRGPDHQRFWGGPPVILEELPATLGGPPVILEKSVAASKGRGCSLLCSSFCRPAQRWAVLPNM